MCIMTVEHMERLICAVGGRKEPIMQRTSQGMVNPKFVAMWGGSDGQMADSSPTRHTEFR